MHHYMAVQCRMNHLHLTPIRKITRFASGKWEVDLSWVQVPFDVVCRTCGDIQQFRGFPVMLIQVEQPIENLPELPEFREALPDDFRPHKKK